MGIGHDVTFPRIRKGCSECVMTRAENASLPGPQDILLTCERVILLTDIVERGHLPVSL